VRLTGQTIGAYRILGQLGRGGMAEVYKAFDTRLDRTVAFKIIRDGIFGREVLAHMAGRFEQEAQALARLTHPHIVRIYDYGLHEGTPYLVMELLEGGSLKQHTGLPHSPGEAAALLLPVAEALAHAHKQGILHRDVKPGNILITADKRPMLTDFGIARMLDMSEDETVSATGVGVGTPEYMAPEQALGEAVDGRADVYGLGVVLYELLTGRRPFEADTPLAVLYQHLNDPLPQPPEPVAPDVRAVLRKALAKQPAERYPDMAAFVEALRMMQGRKRVVGPAPRHAAAGARRAARAPVLAGLAVVGLLAVLGGGLLLAARLRARQAAEATAAAAAQTAAARLAQLEQTAAVRTQVQSRTAAAEAWTATPEPSPTLTDTVVPEPASGATRVRAADGMLQVYVPSGPFLMGSTTEDPTAAENEFPQRTITLDGFWIDQTEVTWGMYAKCEAVGACSAPVPIDDGWLITFHYKDPAYADYPVVWVDWPQADAYCTWASARLPTEAEWEKAARGTDGRIYPWGNQLAERGMSNIFHDSFDAMPVGSHPAGASPYGALDMGGNVSEWVADINFDYAEMESHNPNGSFSDDFIGTYRLFRGGNYGYLASGARVAGRMFSAETGFRTRGFRCAGDPQGE
jgi:eukaryotic-like serine/threonine-protein kinase